MNPTTEREPDGKGSPSSLNEKGWESPYRPRPYATPDRTGDGSDDNQTFGADAVRSCRSRNFPAESEQFSGPDMTGGDGTNPRNRMGKTGGAEGQGRERFEGLRKRRESEKGKI